MKRLPLKRLKADDRGAGIVELALILPALILFIYGIFIVGQLFQAAAGMQHALGEGARYATVWIETTSDHRPQVEEVRTRINAALFKPKDGTFSTPTVDDTQVANGYLTLSVTYTMPTSFLFFTGPTVTITRSKQVHLAV